MKGICGLETKDWTDWIAAAAKKIFHTEYFPRLKHNTRKKTTKYCRFSTKALRDRLWKCLQYVTSVSVAAIFPTDASRSDIHLWNLIQQVGSTEMFHLPNRGCCFNNKTSNPNMRSQTQKKHCEYLLPGFCISWHICRFLSRPGWCWIHFCISAGAISTCLITFKKK